MRVNLKPQGKKLGLGSKANNFLNYHPLRLLGVLTLRFWTFVLLIVSSCFWPLAACRERRLRVESGPS